MAMKTIVLSVKCQGKVFSWEGGRELAMELVDPLLFSDLEEGTSPLLSNKSRVELPDLGTLERTDLIPGTCGWIGLDVDSRRILDAQHYSYPMSTPVLQVRSPNPNDSSWGFLERRGDRLALTDAGMDALGISDRLLRALAQGRWKSRIEKASHPGPAWKTHPAIDRGLPLKQALAPALRHAISQTMRHDSGPNASTVFWMQFKPSLLPGWKRVPSLGFYRDPEHNLRAFEALLTALEDGEWGWRQSVWPYWKEYAQERRDISLVQVEAFRASRTQTKMEETLPEVRQGSSPKPGVRF